MPYSNADVGPDFDATETAKALRYVQSLMNRGKNTEERAKALLAPPGPRDDLLHRMRPIMASTPTYEDGGQQG